MFQNKEEFKKEFSQRLIEAYGTVVEETHPTEKYMVLGQMVRDYASLNWKDTKVAIKKQKAKQVYYFSMEFLLGKMLTNNLKNLGIYDMVHEGLAELGISYENLAAMESDAGLGNGGLGRLAACFMDSSASLNYPVNGNCLRYQCGLFRQVIDKEGNQIEVPDMWLRLGNPWEIRKPKHSVTVSFYGRVEVSQNQEGNLVFKHVDTEDILAVPYDMPMVGANTNMTNTLRLWSAEPADISPYWMDYRKYLSEVNEICLNVYPDDSTEEGKYLRLKQQYFFVSAGIYSIINTHLKQYDTLDNLAEKVTIQLNDTHPVLAIPELMRVLMDQYGYAWKDAFEITRNVMNYTNHTVMSEALESWPMEYIQNLLPRIFMIISELNNQFMRELNQRCFHQTDCLEKISIIHDGKVHMASLAVYGSSHINGVAKLHTELLETDLFQTFYQLYPERFENKTNGITPRRWMLYSNPELTEFLRGVIGDEFLTDFSKISKLMDYVDDEEVQKGFLEVKKQRKLILKEYIKKTTGIEVDEYSIFDTQAKRLHAYKRQLLNIMHVIYLYQRLLEDPSFHMEPHTFLFAAKAAPSYDFAKAVIKLINCVANKVNHDDRVNKVLKVVFLPNYCVSMSEVLMPGTDVSEQISTAGKEASGTGNMKFMMNGAMTLGTLDGANVEIDELVGRDNDVIFGLTVDEIQQMKPNYHAWDYYNGDLRIQKVMNTFIDGTWNGNPQEFRILYDELLMKNDEYMVLADFDAYLKAQQEIVERYRNRPHWAKSCLINIAQSAYFSSDRTIDQYAERIWKIQKVKL